MALVPESTYSQSPPLHVPGLIIRVVPVVLLFEAKALASLCSSEQKRCALTAEAGLADMAKSPTLIAPVETAAATNFLRLTFTKFSQK
jgi:hypothetical protein